MRSQRPDRPGARGFLRPVLHRIRAQPQPQPQPPSEHRPETRSAEAVPLSRPGRQLRHERVIRELVDATTELLAELAESYPQLAADRLRVVGAPETARPDEPPRPLADVVQLHGRMQPSSREQPSPLETVRRRR